MDGSNAAALRRQGATLVTQRNGDVLSVGVKSARRSCSLQWPMRWRGIHVVRLDQTDATGGDEAVMCSDDVKIQGDGHSSLIMRTIVTGGRGWISAPLFLLSQTPMARRGKKNGVNVRFRRSRGTPIRVKKIPRSSATKSIRSQVSHSYENSSRCADLPPEQAHASRRKSLPTIMSRLRRKGSRRKEFRSLASRPRTSPKKSSWA